MKEGCTRGCHRRTPEDHAGLHGLQAPELHHQEEPAQRPRPARAEEVLPELPDAHRAPRDSLPLVAAGSLTCLSTPPSWAAPTRRPRSTRSAARRSASWPTPSATATRP